MSSDNIIDLNEQRRRVAVASFDLDYEQLGNPTELEKAALSFFESITEALSNGSDATQIDRLIDRMDLMLDALDRSKKQDKTGQFLSGRPIR